MDRVVVDPGGVRVVDFKTGSEPRGDDRAQVREYLAILRDVFPDRPVRATLVYLDAAEGVEVE